MALIKFLLKVGEACLHGFFNACFSHLGGHLIIFLVVFVWNSSTQNQIEVQIWKFKDFFLFRPLQDLQVEKLAGFSLVMYVSLGYHCGNFMQQIYIMPYTYKQTPNPKTRTQPKFKQTWKTFRF